MFNSRQRALILTLALCIGFAIGYARVKMSPVVVQDVPPHENTKALAGLDIGGPFTLTDQNGKAVTEASWPGQYLLVYFGFTHCPDICPTGLGKLADALNALPADTVAKIQPLFITIDPARDTADELKKYVTLFHPKLVGLTGTQAQIDAVVKAYRVYAQKAPVADDPQGSDQNYMMNHSSFTYLVAPATHGVGRVVAVYPHDDTGIQMADKIKESIKE
jgi:cytochrome oxidase Cu insertion factor (SCO1/SenC/PrrC family)